MSIEQKDNETKTGKGCIVLGIILLGCLFWGMSGVIQGHGFMASIEENIKAGLIVGLIVLAIYGALHIADKGF